MIERSQLRSFGDGNVLPSDHAPSIVLLTEIDAARDRVFDLARSVDLHTESMNRTREYAAQA